MRREELIAAIEQPKTVEPQAIERELARVWQLADAPLDDWNEADEPPLTRSCMLNVLVVADDEQRADEAREVVRVLNERHPARAIVLRMLPEAAEERVEAAVQAHCYLPSWSRSYVCGEQIDLTVRGPESVRHVRGNLLPLLISDLPTALWWPGSPFGHPLVRRMAELCEHFVVDSAQFDDLALGMAGLLAITDQPGISVDCRDLAWSRLTPWRALIAQFFDSTTARPFLDSLDYVTLTFRYDGAGPLPLAQPLLMIGWLASRLGWQPADNPLERRGDRLLLHLRREGGPLTVDLRTDDERPIPVGALAAVRLQTRSGNPRAEFNVTRLDDPTFVLTLGHVSAAQPVTRVARLDPLETPGLISAEMDLPGRDSTLIAALRAAEPLARLLQAV